jgi:protein-S-isoprenylcysteine O-methyltransferase Ste14
MKSSALIVTIVPLFSIPCLLFLLPPSPWTASRIAGLIILIAGSTLLTFARIQLGNSFSFRPQATQLVTHGLYARIRNPVYVFSTILLAGLVLYLNRPYLFSLFLILIPLQILRAHAEGRVLEARFGEQYRQYKASTWF